MTRIAGSVLLLVVLLAGVALAKPGVVKTNNGQTYEGDVDEHDAASVTVVVRGIQTKIDRSQIASITYTGDKLAELQARQAKLDAKDVAGRVTLARDAMAAQQYVFARDVLEQAREIDPNNAEVVSLLDTVQSQIRMQRAAQRPPEETRATPAPATPATAATTQYAGDVKLLRPSEVNAIRQAETRFPDDPVRVRFDKNVRQRFVEYMGKDEVPNFYQLNQLQQAQMILEKGPSELGQDVIIQNDPPALQTFRQKVQPFVVTSCATVQCHASNVSKLKLVTPVDSDAATYTNFDTLAKYVKPMAAGDNPIFGKPNPRMIDRQHPDQALLLQYALPQAVSEYDHPAVRDFVPPWRTRGDAKYRQIHDWMSVQLKPVDPQYSFEVGATTQATQPASEPASAPAPAPAPPGARPAAPVPARPVRPQPVPPPPPGGLLR